MNVTRSRRMNLALFIWSGLAIAWVLINFVRLFSASCGSFEDAVFSENAVCINIAAHGGRAPFALDFAIRTGIIWAVGIGVLAAIWFIVRDRGPVSASVTVASAPASPADAPAAAHSTPAEGWYADAERPGHTRWWNGTVWGMRDDEDSSLPSATPGTDGDGAGVAAVAVGSPATTLADGGAVAATNAVIAVEPSSEAPPVATSESEPEHAPAQVTPARFCENCGAARSPTGRFCTACGSA